jgi:hypothetical protein
VKGEDVKSFLYCLLFRTYAIPPLAPHSHLRPNPGELDLLPLSLGLAGCSLRKSCCCDIAVVFISQGFATYARSLLFSRN